MEPVTDIQQLSDRAWSDPLTCIREICGVDVFLDMPKGFAGRRMYLPSKPDPQHEILGIMSPEQAELLGRVHGGIEVEIPSEQNARLRRLITLQLLDGFGATEIARMNGCDRRTANKIKAELKRRGQL